MFQETQCSFYAKTRTGQKQSFKICYIFISTVYMLVHNVSELIIVRLPLSVTGLINSGAKESLREIKRLGR